MFTRNGSAWAPAAEISSVDTSSPTLSSTGCLHPLSQLQEIGPRDDVGPLTSSSPSASSRGSGASSIACSPTCVRATPASGSPGPVRRQSHLGIGTVLPESLVVACYRRSSLHVLPTQTHPRWSPPATVAEQYLIPIGSWVSHACGHTAQVRWVRSPVLGSATSGCSSVVRMFVGLRLCCSFPRSHAYRRPLASPRRLTNRLRCVPAHAETPITATSRWLPP